MALLYVQRRATFKSILERLSPLLIHPSCFVSQTVCCVLFAIPEALNTEKMNVVSLNQEIVRSMGCGLLAPLANTIIQEEKSLVHYEMAMTHLTMVGNQP